MIAVIDRIDLNGLRYSFARIDPGHMAIAITALSGGFALSCLRIKLAASDLGYRLSARHAVAALSLGQLGGSAFFQVVGQTIARSAFLGRHGVPVAGAIVLTGYERLCAVAISLGLALWGGLFLFGRITWDLDADGAVLAEVLGGIALAAGAGAAFGWGASAQRFIEAAFGGGALRRIARTLVLSAGVQLLTMSAYVSLARALMPESAVTNLAAASAVVMLAAALPVSFAGWGIRELSTVYALGLVGFASDDAVVVAILIGSIAIAITALMALLSLTLTGRRRTLSVATVPAAAHRLDYEAVLVWVMPIAAATAVFFQVFVPLANARLNVNLADPPAIIGAVVFAAIHVTRRHAPLWRLPGLNLHICFATGVLLLSFLHGWSSIGWTDWAFVNRTIGWFILLAYGATGALLVLRAGESGFSLLLRTYVAVGLAIAALDTALLSVLTAGAQLPAAITHYRLEGLSQNPNAFALQLLLVFAAAATALRAGRTQLLVLSAAMFAIWLTSSRAGWGTLLVTALAAVLVHAVTARRMLVAVALTVLATLLFAYLPTIVTLLLVAVHHLLAMFGHDGAINLTPASVFTNAASRYEGANAERMISLIGGWRLFIAHPIFGAGLGTFIEGYTRAHGIPLVIHSTPLWLAAELGLIGLAAIAIPAIRVLMREFHQREPREPAGNFLILALLAFGTMGLAHDLLYQRAPWLLLGAALARRTAQRQVPARDEAG